MNHDIKEGESLLDVCHVLALENRVSILRSMFFTRVGDSLEVLEAIRQALSTEPSERIYEMVNGYIDRARADLRGLQDMDK